MEPAPRNARTPLRLRGTWAECAAAAAGSDGNDDDAVARLVQLDGDGRATGQAFALGRGGSMVTLGRGRMGVPADDRYVSKSAATVSVSRNRNASRASSFFVYVRNGGSRNSIRVAAADGSQVDLAPDNGTTVRPGGRIFLKLSSGRELYGYEVQRVGEEEEKDDDDEREHEKEEIAPAGAAATRSDSVVVDSLYVSSEPESSESDSDDYRFSDDDDDDDDRDKAGSGPACTPPRKAGRKRRADARKGPGKRRRKGVRSPQRAPAGEMLDRCTFLLDGSVTGKQREVLERAIRERGGKLVAGIPDRRAFVYGVTRHADRQTMARHLGAPRVPKYVRVHTLDWLVASLAAGELIGSWGHTVPEDGNA